ncbi:molybdenum cofactor biosynthesis protein MoaE [Staphylothermus hellenicus]|uniref:Molybdopterin biosynthesis MoaE protein n=1 Tax=Staphylothermus hellenicus (strain DSM 12710 / JCM 10830 / BK20S6-10-b1 / P8) TaxID=591019 RepID=D7DBD5_STAHD|nr:molybdenum cofactor biosynthesis protein MoaE [Staphylothermus hellenicus]ADI31482.1 molybdopterin biosynthesis MoaE protein [Staphylothermus hellenicus DSM 12710]
MPYIRVGLTESIIDVDSIVNELIEHTKGLGGAIVSFIGYVKGIVDDHRVYELQYTAYQPYTEEVMEKIVVEEVRRNNLLGAIVIHRIGNLKPGDPTIYIFVSANTRKEAFKGASEILERIKHEAPIFKLEKRDDGEYWVIGDGRRVARRRAKNT